MKTKRNSGVEAWTDPDDAPKLTESFFARAEIREGDRLIRSARPEILQLEPDVAKALQDAGENWTERANAALRAAFGKRG